ncbi:MAG: hypothetical protein ABIJ31_06835 [Pseudomonadota bacterium]
MKKKIIIVSTLFVVVCLVQSYWMQSGWAQPVAIAQDPVYTFEPVAEGTHITHEFIIKNTGDIVLKILDVLPP